MQSMIQCQIHSYIYVAFSNLFNLSSMSFCRRLLTLCRWCSLIHRLNSHKSIVDNSISVSAQERRNFRRSIDGRISIAWPRYNLLKTYCLSNLARGPSDCAHRTCAAAGWHGEGLTRRSADIPINPHPTTPVLTEPLLDRRDLCLPPSVTLLRGIASATVGRRSIIVCPHLSVAWPDMITFSHPL